jgi:hypothetical protein
MIRSIRLPLENAGSPEEPNRAVNNRDRFSAVLAFIEGGVVQRRSACLMSGRVAGQSAGSRAPDGHPDLQGYWYFGTATPLERPKEFEGKAYVTREEAAGQ